LDREGQTDIQRQILRTETLSWEGTSVLDIRS
jgi:hypothetical protein